MNELMTAIRRAIREGSLHEEEKKWLAPGLRSWESQKPEAFVSVAGPGDAEIARINEAHGARVNRAGAARVSGAGGACINGAKGALVSGQV